MQRLQKWLKTPVHLAAQDRAVELDVRDARGTREAVCVRRAADEPDLDLLKC